MRNLPDERTAERNQRIRLRRKKRRIRIVALVLMFLIAIFAVLSLTVLFPVKQISVVGDSPYSDDEIISASGIKTGDNIWMAGRFGSAGHIQKELPYIKSVSFKRTANGNLKIVVKQTAEVYSFYTNNCYAVTDADRKVLRISKSQPEDLLPVITYRGVYDTVGEIAQFRDHTDKQLFEMITKEIKEQELDIKGIDISKSYQITLKITQRFIVLLGSKNNLEDKLHHFNRMSEKIDITRKGIIDLSAWTTSNEEGYFRDREISSFFSNVVITPVENDDENTSSSADNEANSSTKNEKNADSSDIDD